MNNTCEQWHKDRGAECPLTFSRGNYCWPTGKKRGMEEQENVEEKKENFKGKRWKIENGRGKGMKMSRGLFLFWFFCFCFCFFVFCFFACHFLKPLKFVWGLPKWTILPGKIIFHTGKKSGKVTLPPLKNIPLMPLRVSWQFLSIKTVEIFWNDNDKYVDQVSCSYIFDSHAPCTWVLIPAYDSYFSSWVCAVFPVLTIFGQ